MALQIPGYRIIRKINQGGMSTVYLAIQISVGRIVALKVMNPSLTRDPAFSERFQTEAIIVGQLSHPNIVAIYDIGREDDLNYIAMDYLPGGSVHDRMIHGITGEEALKITKEIANALDHAHEKGYIHRDIKPENILFRADNSAVLSDFGVAKGIVGVSRMTHVGTVVGTPHYMSPEQTRGQTVDARSDLYSLGIVFFEMLTGALPYQGEDAVTIALKHISAPIPRLPIQYQAYQKILEKFLAKDPEQRFQSGHEASAAIEQFDASNRTPTTANTAPENLSVMALVRALVAATSSALKNRWNKLISLRWSKELGFYTRNLDSNVVFDREVSPTTFSKRLQHQTHINPILLSRNKNVQIMVGSAMLLLMLWCVLSVILHTQFSQRTAKWPLAYATKATANLFVSVPPPAPLKPTAIKPMQSPIVKHSSASASTAASLATSSLPLPAVSSSAALAASSAPVFATASEATSSQLSSSSTATYALSIKTTPSDARIRLLGISSKYKEGLQLVPGRYRIEIAKIGYLTKTEIIELKNQALSIAVELEHASDPSSSAKAAIPNIVYGGKNAPALIKIPAGSFTMGDDSHAHTAPSHKVTLSKAFAISKYEITFEEYDFFAQSTGKPLPGDNGWGREDRPVIHVSWEDANSYAQWLSKTTGKKFRLPSEAEWEYVSRAGNTSRYWWGDSEQDAKGKANCRRGCSSSFSGLFGSKTAPVGSYLPNAFGVHDTAGNVSEWVQDCYAENYANANPNGRALDQKQCQGRVVRGGSTKDNIQRLSSSARDNIPSGYLNESLGFRLVMELN
jgi:serine/threonine-protein kinase PpkA